MIKIAFFTSTRGDLASLNPIIKEVERTKGFKPLLFVGGTHLYKNGVQVFKQLNQWFNHTATFSDGGLRWNWPPHSFFNRHFS